MWVNMQEAKSHLSRLGRLAWAGEEVVICRNGEPYLRLTTYEPVPRVPGVWKGQVWMAPDFDETPVELVAAFEDAQQSA